MKLWKQGSIGAGALIATALVLPDQAMAGGALGIEWASTAQSFAEEGVDAGGWFVVLGWVIVGLLIAVGMSQILQYGFSMIAGGSIAAGALVLGSLMGAGAGGGSVMDVTVPAQHAEAPSVTATIPYRPRS